MKNFKIENGRLYDEKNNLLGDFVYDLMDCNDLTEDSSLIDFDFEKLLDFIFGEENFIFEQENESYDEMQELFEYFYYNELSVKINNIKYDLDFEIKKYKDDDLIIDYSLGEFTDWINETFVDKINLKIIY